MESIFRNLLDQPGIHAALVLNSEAGLLTYQSDSLYDATMLQNVAFPLARALDSVDLLHEQWDDLQIQFADGSLMARNLGASTHRSGRTSLVVVTDTSFNRSFVTVAMRVVVQKLKQAVQSGANLSQLTAMVPDPHASSSAVSHPSVPGAASSRAYPPGPPPQPPRDPAYLHPGTNPFGSRPSLENDSSLNGTTPGMPLGPEFSTGSGLSWSGVSGNQSSGISVAVSDPEAMRLLNQLTASLAPFVGPMAKVFVKEAVRGVCHDSPFSRNRLAAVIQVLAQQIEDPADHQRFVASVQPI